MAREALVKNRTTARNRAKKLTLPILKRQNAEQLKQIERQVSTIEKEVMTLIKADPDLARRCDIRVSIPGLATITAFAMIIDMPELGTLENGQAASLAGLAPIARQSGTWTGRAFIRAGRDQLKAQYHHLIAAGKPAKKAITATMRKRIILANARIRNDRNRAPDTP